MRVTDVDHIVVICTDVEQTLGWWQRELGLEPRRLDDWRSGVAPFPSLMINARTIIDFLPGERSGENVAHVALTVDVDADSLEELAAERGWDVVAPLNRRLYGARGIGAGLYIRDPEGNILELRAYPSE